MGALGVLLALALAASALAAPAPDSGAGIVQDDGGQAAPAAQDPSLIEDSAAPADSGPAPVAESTDPDSGTTPNPDSAASDDEDLQISSVKVNGLENLDEATVLSALTIRPGDILVGNFTEKLNEAAQALFESGWFTSAPQLSLESSGPGSAILNVTVQENPPYKAAHITGNTLFSEDRLLMESDGQ